MILAYHLILSAYGFWLPNDPRGSWSDFVGAWELLRYGRATKVTTRRSLAHDPHDRELRLAAKEALRFPPVHFTEPQIDAVAEGFARSAREGGYVIFACAILHDHTHLVLERHDRDVTRIAGHLKAHATRELRARALHPFERSVSSDGSVPSCWAGKCWKVFIHNEEHLRRAVEYVEDNPVKEGRAQQQWWFVQHPDAPRKRGG